MVINLCIDSCCMIKVILHLKTRFLNFFMNAFKFNDTCVLKIFFLLGTSGCKHKEGIWVKRSQNLWTL